MDTLDLLYRKLAHVAARERPAETRQSFTVADIYQSLVPYRAVREELGLVELAHYEHALLRLLAGERGYVTVDLPAVVEELQRELASSNPILGIYRDYASVTVHVAAAPAPRPAPSAPAQPPSPSSSPAPAPAHPAARACPGCAAVLPMERGIRFCPFCGAEQEPESCRDCGTLLRPEWNFCVRCGKAR